MKNAISAGFVFIVLILNSFLATAKNENRFDTVSYSNTPNMASIWISKNNKVVLERYFKGANSKTLHDTRSATKSLTALAFGILMEQQDINLQSKAFAFLKSHHPFKHSNEDKLNITIRDLLAMSSVLDCDDNDMQSPGNEEHMYPLQEWVRWAVDIPTKSKYQRDENGFGSFSYCTAGTVMLGQIITNVSGMDLDTFFKQNLFEPLGIKSWRWAKSPTDEFMTGGGLRLTSGDLGKIGQMILQDGKWQGKQIVPANWIKEALTPRIDTPYGDKYGYLFWNRNWKTQCGVINASYMTGNGGNKVVVIPEKQIVVVLTRTHYGQRGMHQQSNKLIESLLSKVTCE